MASSGSLLVLHEPDYANIEKKNETRNLGLQSIVDREDNAVGSMLSDANDQLTVANESILLIERTNAIITNLTWIANSIYEVIQNAYFADTSKTPKLPVLIKRIAELT